MSSICYAKYMTSQNNKIIAFVGMSGAGKSEAVEHLTAKGIPRVYFGGVVLDMMTELGLELTQKNEQPFREELRRKHGTDFVVKQIVQQIRNLIAAGQHYIVADGLYTWTEYKVLKHEFPGELTVIAIVAPKQLRYHRIGQRPVRPLSHAGAIERDWAEIENLEKGGPIAIADYFIINDGDLDTLHRKIDEITQAEHFCKAPEQC